MYAPKHNVERLAEDAANAKCLAEKLAGLKNADVQTNMVLLDISKSGFTPKEYAACLRKAGVLVHPVMDRYVRLVFYKGITRDDTLKADAGL